MMSNAKNFDILANLDVLHNFVSSLKLFADVYSAKFLDTSAKLFFPCFGYIHFSSVSNFSLDYLT